MSDPMAGVHEPVVLEGRHVRLEPLTRDHATGVLAAADSDEVFTWLPFRRPTDLETARALVDRYLDAPDLVAWAQVDRASGQVAGLTAFYDISVEQRTVAIGWTWLATTSWRTGVNTEAKLLLLTHAFDALGCVRAVWHTDERNLRSQQAIERLGARREGSLRKHKRRPDGTWRDTAIYSMTDDEWPAAHASLQSRLDR